MKNKTRILLPALALFLGASSLAQAAIMAKVRVNGNPQVQAFAIRWNGVKKVYILADKGGGEVEYKPEKVEILEVMKPQQWDQLKPRVQKGDTAAIGQAMKIADEYKMCYWDAAIGATVAEAHMRNKKTAEALSVCQKIIGGNANAGFDSVLAPVYWRALAADNQKDKLESLLKKGVTSQIPSVAAQACLRRGELLAEKGDTKGALRNGFLRVVLLYSDRDIGPETRAEALYRAGKAFEKIGQTSYADRMNEELRTKYAKTEWGNKLLSGK